MLWMIAALYPACCACSTYNVHNIGYNKTHLLHTQSSVHDVGPRESPLYRNCSRSVWWERWIWWRWHRRWVAAEEGGLLGCRHWVGGTSLKPPAAQTSYIIKHCGSKVPMNVFLQHAPVSHHESFFWKWGTKQSREVLERHGGCVAVLFSRQAREIIALISLNKQ